MNIQSEKNRAKTEKQNVIFFDFDGVLLRSFELCYGITHHFHPQVTPDEYRTWFDGNIYKKLQQIDTSGEDPDGDNSHRAFWEKYADGLKDWEIIDVMKVLVPDLAKTHRLAVVTASLQEYVHDYLTAHEIRNCFDDILCRNSNPSKVEKFRITMKKYDVVPEQCLFITDTLGDVKEANEVGLSSIAVTWGWHDKATLEQGRPHKILDDPHHLKQTIKDFFA